VGHFCPPGSGSGSTARLNLDPIRIRIRNPGWGLLTQDDCIFRYNIRHPVCNDAKMELWGRLGVTCWPTLLLLSPQGVPIHVTMGEGHQAFLTEYLHVAMQFFKGDESPGGRFYSVSYVEYPVQYLPIFTLSMYGTYIILDQNGSSCFSVVQLYTYKEKLGFEKT
jgi:hypothetical protein